MNQELQLKLIEDFPILYGKKETEWLGRTVRTTFSLYGFEIAGDGWESLIRELSEKLENLNLLYKEPQVQVTQVKEKFGNLSFYVSTDHEKGIWETVQNLIAISENKSSETCEVCGKCGKITDGRKRGWIRTLCSEHAEEHYNDQKIR